MIEFMMEFRLSMNRGKGALRFGVILVVLLAGGASAEAAGWWNLGYRYRREVTVPQVKPTGLGGQEIAVVTMPTGGFGSPDGKDFRVVTSAGREVASRVLMTGPGDRVRIAFAIFPRTVTYHVYYGGKNPAPRKKLDIRRGVLQEVWEYPGGAANNFAQVRNVLGKAGKLLGRDFRRGMFLGYNPFGPQNRIVSVFTGWFVCRKGATYEIACTAQGASFLHIDDKLVHSAGGWRAPQRRIRRGGKVAVSAGLHKMTLHHVCVGGNPTTMVVWRGPGQERFRVFPADLFTRVTTATPGPMKKYGVAVDVDFVPVHAGEAFMNNRYFQRYTFKALMVGRTAARPNWKWDFGDGDTSEKPAAEHVYLKPGWYTVTLAGRTHIGRLKRTNRIYVNRPWDRVTSGRLDSIKGYAKIVAGYDFQTLRSDLLAEAAHLFERTAMSDAILVAGTAFVRRDKAEPAEIKAVIPLYADTLIARSQPAAAVKALLRGTKMTNNPDAHVELLSRAGRVQLDRLGNVDAAMKLFTQVIDSYQKVSRAPGIQDARFGIGDVWRARGDYDKAKDAYAKIKIPVRKPADAVLHKGDLAMHVENYTRQRDFAAAEDYLRRWQEAFPLDKLEGYWSLLRVKLSMARKQYAAAAREAEVLALVNQKSNYGAGLLMIAADAYGRLGKKKQAADALERIVELYPESSLATEAARKLKGP